MMDSYKIYYFAGLFSTQKGTNTAIEINLFLINVYIRPKTGLKEPSILKVKLQHKKLFFFGLRLG